MGGGCEEPACDYEEALDVLDELVLIANLSEEYYYNNNNNNNQEINVVLKYINVSLRSRLGYKEKESHPLDAKLNVILEEDGKYHGQAVIKNSFQQSVIFFAVGTIKSNGKCFFKLIDTRDEQFILKKFYDKCGHVMSVLEKGSEEEYEWRHILPNSYLKNTFPALVSTDFVAKNRHDIDRRMRCHEAFAEAKLGGYSVFLHQTLPLVRESEIVPSGAFFDYLYTDPNSNSDMFSMVVFDVIELKRARERIKELTDFFDYAPLGMGVVELRGDTIMMLYGNKTVTASLGNTHDLEVTEALCPPDILAIYKRLYRKTRETMATASEEYTMPAYGYHCELTVSCISYDKEKDVSKHVYIMVDKTVERRVEKELERHRATLEDTVKARTLELKEKECRLSSLVSNAPNIILTVDKDGVVEFANRHFVNDDASLLIGRYLYTMFVEGEELRHQIRALFESKRPFTCEVKLVEKDVWLTLSAGPMSESLAIIVATDITEIKQMAEELNNALTTKSRFLANMSHEVRTPLSGIIGMSRMLQETGLTLDQTECVATIQYCGETLLSVINSILDYTKLEGSDSAITMALDRSEISLQQCVEESLYAILPAARQKKLELIVDIDPRVPDRILGDIIRLRQVMLNLLNNAVKFTDEGYIAVSLTATEVEGSEDFKFNFAIHDTGCGVPVESQGKLFQMFSQVDVSTTRRYGGTGIGLALAKRFLEMMDGEISLESRGIPGEGSTFHFSITATPTPFVPVSPSRVSPRWLVSSTNIFIIERCKAASEVLKKRLYLKGFRSITTMYDDPYVQAFADIIKFASSSSNVLVFCDIDLLNASMSYPLAALPNVVTAFMGYLRPKTFDVDFGKSEFLRKPIKESTLIACLREVWSTFDANAKPRAKIPRMSTAMNIPREVYPLNILVVEDNEINQKVVRRVFQHLGYSLNIANNGMEALVTIENNGMPDMILMDVQMPVLDGVQTTKIIRQKYPSTWVYIVSMTANAFPEDRQNCLDAGMNDFLTKPLRVEQLQIALQKCHNLKLSSKPATSHLGLRITV